DLARLRHTTLRLFPSDHAVIVMTAFPAAGERWLTVFKDGHVMGLRPRVTREQQGAGGVPAVTLGSGAGFDRPNSESPSDPAAWSTNFSLHFADGARLVASQTVGAPSNASNGVSSGNGGGGGGSSGGGGGGGSGAVSIAITLPCGLIVTHCSVGGGIRQQRVGNARPNAAAATATDFTTAGATASIWELHRTIVRKGTVVRVLLDGSREMLFATGEVLRLAAGGAGCTLTDKRGRRFARTTCMNGGSVAAPDAAKKGNVGHQRGSLRFSPSTVADPGPSAGGSMPAAAENSSGGGGRFGDGVFGGDFGGGSSRWQLLPSEDWAPASELLDVGTGAVCWCRADGSSVSLFPNGTVLTRHADGTTQRTSAPLQNGAIRTGKVLVETPGLASVEVDVDSDSAAIAHIQDLERRRLRRGGPGRIRTTTALPDGGIVLVTYDARSTTQIRGKVVHVAPDRTEMIASEDGTIVVRPSRLWEGTPAHARMGEAGGGMPSRLPEPDRLVGCYRFHLPKGLLDVEDFERNRFRVGVATPFLPSGTASSSALGASPKSSAPGSPSRQQRPLGPAAAAAAAAARAASAAASAGAIVDLAGRQLAELSATAVVNAPAQPRLLVCRRDGSAVELLRGADVEGWERRLAAAAAHDPAAVVRGEPRRVRSDPADLGATLHTFQMALPPPRPRGGDGFFEHVCSQRGLEGLLAFDAGYVGGSGISRSGGGTTGSLTWRVRPLPLCASLASGLPASSAASAAGASASAVPPSPWAATVAVRRALEERLPLSPPGRRELRQAVAAWRRWRRERAGQLERFRVIDPRTPAQLEAEAAAATLARKAYKVAKALR
ncbi:unnamed protein product, partial [Phaeothamnion confervicola]